MKNVKLVIFFLILFCFCLNVKALNECSSSEMARLKELASNVKFDYDYTIKEYEDEESTNINVLYRIKILNKAKDLKISYKIDDDDYEYEVPNNEDIFGEFLSGDKIKIIISAYTSNLCSGTILKIVNLNLPYYNLFYYYNKDVCNQYEEFKYCKEWSDTSTLTDDKFNSEFEKYKKSLDKDGKFIINYDNKVVYIAIIGIVLIIIVFVILIIINKRRRKAEDL